MMPSISVISPTRPTNISSATSSLLSSPNYLFDIGSGSGFIVQNVYLCPFGVDHDRQEAPVPGTVKGQEIQGVGSPAEHALAQPVLRVGFVGDFIDLLLAA